MSRPILDDLTRALFAHLRGGNACFDEENELIALFRRCPHCARSLRPLILDTFTDEENGQQYERMWWTCPGIEQKECFFPLDIPKEVFWTRRTMEQSLRGIHPLPNLHLLPRSLRTLYPKLFKNKFNLERIVRLSSFAPSDGQKNVARHANLAAEEQPSRHAVAEGGQCVRGAVGPSPVVTPPPPPFSVRFRVVPVHRLLISPNSVQFKCPAFCAGVPSSSRSVYDQQTVHSFLKETLHKRTLYPREEASVQREHRRAVDLSPDVNAALNSNILLMRANGDPAQMISYLKSTPATFRNQPTVRRYLSQQQHVRLKGMLRRSMPVQKRNDPAQRDRQCFSRYLFTRTEGKETTTKSAQKRPKGQAKTGGERWPGKQRNRALDVSDALNTLQKSSMANDLMSRFCGRQRSTAVTPSKEATRIQRERSNETETTDSSGSGDPFRALVNASLPQSPTVGRQSTNSANSSESNGSSLGRRRRGGLSIGPAFPGVSDNVEDPSLAEKITRNYESIFLKTLEQMNNSRRSVTPSTLPLPRLCPGSPRLGHFMSDDEAVCTEEGTLGGIPHDFHFFSVHQPVVPSLPPAVRPSNQLTSINYAEGEDLTKRFAQKQMEVVELSQQQQQQMPPNLALSELSDYDAFLGFGLEEEGDPTELDMTPMMPAGEAEDERDFLRAQLGMLP